MANKLNVVAQLRSSVSAMIDGYNASVALAHLVQALGWTAADFDQALEGRGADVTGEEIIAALASINGLGSVYAAQAAALAPIKL